MCDTMVRLADDGVLFAKNSDRDPGEAQHLEWVAAGDHAPAGELRCTWITVPQVARTHAVLLSRPWWIWGAEMGANEHGVVIGNEAVFTRGAAEPEPGLIGMDLLRLALERSTSAHEAVGVIVELLERHGQGGSCSRVHTRFSYDNSFLVADRSGAVVLETAGRRWATEQVVGPARSISNGLTIPGFAEAHADRLRTTVSSCRTRTGLTRSATRRAEGPLDLMAALRDHGGRAVPRYSPLNGGMGAPCMHAGGGLLTNSQTTASWVADLRDDPLHWVTATAAPCTSIFKPVRVDRPVDLGPSPNGHHDARTLWWRHERLHRAAMRDPGALIARYAHERDRTEAAWVQAPPGSAEAFAAADGLTHRWSHDVDRASRTDLRPRPVRWYWERQDRRDHMPRSAPSGPAAPAVRAGLVPAGGDAGTR